MQRFDAMGNERQVHDCFDGPDQQSKKEVGSVILYKEERKCRDRDIKDGDCAQKNATVGAIQANGPAPAVCRRLGGWEWRECAFG